MDKGTWVKAQVTYQRAKYIGTHSPVPLHIGASTNNKTQRGLAEA
jgi:hypothetical protein